MKQAVHAAVYCVRSLTPHHCHDSVAWPVLLLLLIVTKTLCCMLLLTALRALLKADVNATAATV